MQASHRPTLTLLASLALIVTATAEPASRRVDRVADRAARPHRALVRELMAGYDELLAFLPLEKLERTIAAANRLELVFSSNLEVELGGRRQAVWVKGRIEWNETEARTLLVNQRVHFQFDETGLCGVCPGDLEIRAGWFTPDVKLRTIVARGRTAKDSEGRVLLATDERGRPIRRSGRWVPLRADRWLVLTVQGHRFDIPLQDPPKSGC